jgi:5'-3' exonuclease
VDEAWVSAKYAIPGRAYADMAILRGDASDGLPGVRGIGEKTAAQLIARYGSLEGVIEAAMTSPLGALAKVKAAAEYLTAAARVVLLPHDLDLGPIDLTRPREPADPEALEELAARYGMTGPVRRLVAALAGGNADA